MHPIRFLSHTKSTIPLLIVAVVLLSACLRRVVSVAEVDKMVKDQLPIGSGQQQVRAFIDNLKIDSLKIERDEMHKYDRGGFGNLDPEKTAELGDRIAMYTGAFIKDARSGFLTHDDIQMIFYFDKDGGMIGYTVLERGTE